MSKCCFMTWNSVAKGDDYVPCDSNKVKHYRLQGLLLTVDVVLCEAHRKYLEKRPKGWGTVEVVEIKLKRRENAKAKSERTIQNS